MSTKGVNKNNDDQDPGQALEADFTPAEVFHGEMGFSLDSPLIPSK